MQLAIIINAMRVSVVPAYALKYRLYCMSFILLKEAEPTANVFLRNHLCSI